ncbi:unnamed protein product [Schistosoma spindalis]|nr:unnamed protein product [Schistosoma spindale]
MKGDVSKCENYTGITLLSVPGKLSNGVLLNRSTDSVDAQIHDQQVGFREDRSCTEQFATLQIIVEQSIQWNSSLNATRLNMRKHLTAWIGDNYRMFHDTII